MLRMMFWPNREKPEPSPDPDAGATGSDPRRRVTRHKTEVITCALGEVADLSRAGMRLICKTKPPLQPGREAQIRLVFPRGSILVTVQARWLKRRGLRTYEMGFQFLNLTEAAEKALDSLAHFGFISKEAAAAGKAPPIRATVQLPDYYSVLGLQRGASIDQIHQAYRKMARVYHPDLNKESDAETKFMKLREAYDVLTDTEQRGSYDNRAAG